MEDWPPVYYDYQSKLLERKLRVVEFKNWALEPELNDRGILTKLNENQIKLKVISIFIMGYCISSKIFK